MATIRDVANRAGVSVGTVSNVINDRGAVRPALRRAVEEAIGALHYQPNAAARSLRTARTHAIGLVLSGLRDPLHVAAIMSNVERVANEQRCAVLLVDTQRDAATEERTIRSLLERRIDGLLCAPLVSPTTVHDLIGACSVPTVIFARLSPSPLFPSATIDESAATDAIAAELALLGHQRVALVYSDSPFWDRRRRLLREALARHAISARAVHEIAAATTDDCLRQVRALMTCSTPPTAILVLAHGLIPAVLSALRTEGVRIPEDVSIVAHDDSEWARLADPPLNVVAFDFDQHIADAARLLFQHIERSTDDARSITHTARYVRRASVAPARSDAVVRAAGRRRAAGDRTSRTAEGHDAELTLPVLEA